MKKTIGTFEAKTHFAKIISQVMEGEEITVTRRGKTVAKIVPVDSKMDSEATQAALLRIRKLAKEMNLGHFNWEEWKEYREEGRR